MIDRVVDGICHARTVSLLSAPRVFGALGGDRLDLLAFAHEVLPLHDHARAVGDAADPHVFLLVLDDRHRHERDLVVGIDDAHAEIARRREGQRRARHARGRDRRQRDRRPRR